MNIVFFGSDDFALAHLEALIESDNKVVGCVTQSDKAKNRGMKVVISPIKECALRNEIEVLQPTDLEDKGFIASLEKLNADIFVVIAYGRFLPVGLIEMPKYKAINVHGSLLPKYRGAAPINWAIINGETETGITIFRINAKMDAGDLLSEQKILIDPEDNSATLREKMKKQGQKLLLKTIDEVEVGGSNPRMQIEEEATFAPKLTKKMGLIDWSKTAVEIRNLVRGLQPWPGAYSFYNGKQLKILSAEVINIQGNPGEIVDINEKGFVVAACNKGLLVKEVHLQDANPMDAPSFMRGHKLEIGCKFNS
jgi:methionyl-tRNA formyltransferase